MRSSNGRDSFACVLCPLRSDSGRMADTAKVKMHLRVLFRKMNVCNCPSLTGFQASCRGRGHRRDCHGSHFRDDGRNFCGSNQAFDLSQKQDMHGR